MNNKICHIFNLQLWINICVFHTTVSKLNHLVQDFNNERKQSYIVTCTRMMLSRTYDVITCVWCYHVRMMLSRAYDVVTCAWCLVRMMSRAHDVVTCAWCCHVRMMLSRAHDVVTCAWCCHVRMMSRAHDVSFAWYMMSRAHDIVPCEWCVDEQTSERVTSQMHTSVIEGGVWWVLPHSGFVGHHLNPPIYAASPKILSKVCYPIW